MRKTTKVWLIIAASLVLVGCIIFGGVMKMLYWDFSKLGTVKYETNTYQVSEEFSNISLKTETADILLATSDDGMCRVVCYEPENAKHSVVIQDGTLTVNAVDQRKWYEYIGIITAAPKITVYLPDADYDMLFIKESTGDIEIPKDFKFESMDISVSTGDVTNHASASGQMKIKTSTGDIRIENASAGTLDLSVTTGKVIAEAITCEGDIKINVSTGDTKLTDATCKNVVTTGSTGRITLKNVIAIEKLSIERSTGDVKLDGCDATEIIVKTSTGRVNGSLLSDKVFITQTNTGSVDVPKTVTGGRCEITTDTGDIRIKIEQ